MNQIYSYLRVSIIGSLFLIISHVSYGQCGCTFIISGTTNQFDGAAKGVKPGDKICFSNGIHPNIWMNNIVGTAANPVTITNMCDGKATINAAPALGQAMEFTNSSYFRVTGKGNTTDSIGLDITGAVHGMNVHTFTHHVEIDHVNIHDTNGCGIVVKTDPTCNPLTWRGNFLLEGVSCHDLLITNTFTEGFYIGNSHYDGGVTKVCGGVNTLILGHRCPDV